MANSDVLYKDPIDEVTIAEIRPHIKSAVDEIKDQCDRDILSYVIFYSCMIFF